MPQNNVLPDWRATYPLDAPVQKPGGVTVLTTATAPRVPNKPTYSAGTIQMLEEAAVAAEEVINAAEEVPEEEVDEEEPPPTRGRSRRR
jgi:hypothetical protein